MASNYSSSGWFKKAEEIEQERKSGTVAPPAARVPFVRPPSKPDVGTEPKSTPDTAGTKSPPDAAKAPPPPPDSAPIRLVAAAPTPASIPNPGSRTVSGTFSLIPDGAAHRLVYAGPRSTDRAAPVILGGLTVPELRQLQAALARYLLAVDPADPPPAE